MVVVFFTRSGSDRIFIGIDYDGEIHRMGHRVIEKDGSIRLEKYLWKETGNVSIISDPDMSKVHPQDLKFYNNYFKNI